MSNSRFHPFRRLGVFVTALALSSFGPAWGLDLSLPYGGASYKFLKLPLSPRIVALGGSGAALADEAGDVDLNPAAAASDSGFLILGRGYPSHEFQNTSSHVFWSVPMHSYRIIVNARYLGFNNIPGYDGLDQPTTSYGAHTLKVQTGAAGRYQRLTWGATVNYAENNIAEANYGTAMVNVGLRYPVWRGLYAGVSVVNADFWKSPAKDPAYSPPVPPTALQAGLAYTHAITNQFDAAVAVDARKRNDEKPAYPVGVELSWQKMVYARAGWPVGGSEPWLNWGLGLHWSHFRFDYSYQGHATLSPGNFFTLGVNY